jgi:Domain of unknown function (DUF6891)
MVLLLEVEFPFDDALCEARTRRHLCFTVISCKPQPTPRVTPTFMETPSNPITAETIDELNQYIQGRVADGFSPEDEISMYATEYFSEDYNSEELMRHAIQLTRKLVAQHREDQKSWPESTDCDKLDAAFAELETAPSARAAAAVA